MTNDPRFYNRTPYKPRQVSYLYRCLKCGRESQRGSSAKWCYLPFGGYKCRGSLMRLKTVKGPVRAD